MRRTASNQQAGCKQKPSATFASKLHLKSCCAPGKIGKEKIETRGGEAEDRMRELNAQGIRGDGERAKGDTEKNSIKLSEDDCPQRLQPDEDAEPKQNSRFSRIGKVAIGNVARNYEADETAGRRPKPEKRPWPEEC